VGNVEKPQTNPFYFVGNNLALDFINSDVSDPDGQRLGEWAVEAGLIRGFPSWNKGELSRLAAFRERLRKMAEELSRGGDISTTDIDTLNGALRRGSRHVELKRGAEGFVKRIDIDIDRAQDLEVPIAESFADLLCYGTTDYLKKCGSPQCSLYFYDTTKNHRRRWCSMAVCGNRAKASKFYSKKKSVTA
jgi:predicted RNA-binding Zn ribbon-like protein